MEELDIRLVAPESRIVSVRLNREEQRILTNAARFHGEKLSTYIKQRALRSASSPQTKITVNLL